MTSLKLHTVCVISMGTFCVVAMLRTAALASRPCVGRRSTSLAITRGSTSTSKRGLAAHASSHGDDHHHDAAHHHHPPPMPPFARLPVPTQKVRLGRYDFTRQTFLVWISKVVCYLSCCSARSSLPNSIMAYDTTQLYEQNDAVFDDGVAPELALDFDCQNISSREALASWLGAFGVIYLFYNLIKWTDPESQRPALKQHDFIVQTLPYGISDVANLHAVFPPDATGHDTHGDDDEEEEEEEE